MLPLVGYMALFLVIAVVFVAFHLLLGRLVRPNRPSAEKATIYECGEPTIGSAWIQFDLRFYVVALLFVIFDVEVAFFFPWATVFGKANTLAKENLPPEARVAITQQLVPASLPAVDPRHVPPQDGIPPQTAHSFAWLAVIDIVVFFGVLLVGFAYLWRRGDIDWVRSTTAERMEDARAEAPQLRPEDEVLIEHASGSQTSRPV